MVRKGDMFGLFKNKEEKLKQQLNKKAENILTCIDELKVQLTKIENEVSSLEQEIGALDV